MSKQAMYDAFMAGWLARAGLASRPLGIDAEGAFAEWYTNAVATGDRSPNVPTQAAFESQIDSSMSGYLRNMSEWERQRDIDAEGQRAAIYHGGLAKRSKPT